MTGSALRWTLFHRRFYQNGEEVWRRRGSGSERVGDLADDRKRFGVYGERWTFHFRPEAAKPPGGSGGREPPRYAGGLGGPAAPPAPPPLNLEARLPRFSSD